ncbi:hypothetical protein HMN09_00563000 [Mycena chlorophos]|uniref:Uncharacterized protein n=1 Tax=Mycena chlorophos TaxID=658473 RepID=A0A8H6TB16_MYCCL|nr:hypothetical protein HMN09_00563000 [Mycena chlorophos]
MSIADRRAQKQVPRATYIRCGQPSHAPAVHFIWLNIPPAALATALSANSAPGPSPASSAPTFTFSQPPAVFVPAGSQTTAKPKKSSYRPQGGVQLCAFDGPCTNNRIATNCSNNMCKCHCGETGGCSKRDHNPLGLPRNAPLPTPSSSQQPALPQSTPSHSAPLQPARYQPVPSMDEELARFQDTNAGGWSPDPAFEFTLGQHDADHDTSVQQQIDQDLAFALSLSDDYTNMRSLPSRSPSPVAGPSTFPTALATPTKPQPIPTVDLTADSPLCQDQARQSGILDGAGLNPAVTGVEPRCASRSTSTPSTTTFWASVALPTSLRLGRRGSFSPALVNPDLGFLNGVSVLWLSPSLPLVLSLFANSRPFLAPSASPPTAPYPLSFNPGTAFGGLPTLHPSSNTFVLATSPSSVFPRLSTGSALPRPAVFVTEVPRSLSSGVGFVDWAFRTRLSPSFRADAPHPRVFPESWSREDWLHSLFVLNARVSCAGWIPAIFGPPHAFFLVFFDSATAHRVPASVLGDGVPPGQEGGTVDLRVVLSRIVDQLLLAHVELSLVGANRAELCLRFLPFARSLLRVLANLSRLGIRVCIGERFFDSFLHPVTRLADEDQEILHANLDVDFDDPYEAAFLVADLTSSVPVADRFDHQDPAGTFVEDTAWRVIGDEFDFRPPRLVTLSTGEEAWQPSDAPSLFQVDVLALDFLGDRLGDSVLDSERVVVEPAPLAWARLSEPATPYERADHAAALREPRWLVVDGALQELGSVSDDWELPSPPWGTTRFAAGTLMATFVPRTNSARLSLGMPALDHTASMFRSWESARSYGFEPTISSCPLLFPASFVSPSPLVPPPSPGSPGLRPASPIRVGSPSSSRDPIVISDDEDPIVISDDDGDGKVEGGEASGSRSNPVPATPPPTRPATPGASTAFSAAFSLAVSSSSASSPAVSNAFPRPRLRRPSVPYAPTASSSRPLDERLPRVTWSRPAPSVPNAAIPPAPTLRPLHPRFAHHFEGEYEGRAVGAVVRSAIVSSRRRIPDALFAAVARRRGGFATGCPLANPESVDTHPGISRVPRAVVPPRLVVQVVLGLRPRLQRGILVAVAVPLLRIVGMRVSRSPVPLRASPPPRPLPRSSAPPPPPAGYSRAREETPVAGPSRLRPEPVRSAGPVITPADFGDDEEAVRAIQERSVRERGLPVDLDLESGMSPSPSLRDRLRGVEVLDWTQLSPPAALNVLDHSYNAASGPAAMTGSDAAMAVALSHETLSDPATPRTERFSPWIHMLHQLDRFSSSRTLLGIPVQDFGDRHRLFEDYEALSGDAALMAATALNNGALDAVHIFEYLSGVFSLAARPGSGRARRRHPPPLLVVRVVRIG